MHSGIAQAFGENRRLLEGRRGETYPDMDWEPKEAFTAVAERYRR
ncbi:hypothetical protein [Kitasatospora sp. NPDC057541]